MTTKDEALRMARDALRALELIRDQDQGCGGTVTEAEAWRSAQSIARNAALNLRAAISAEQAELQSGMPELPPYPKHGWVWTRAERRAIVAYGRACADAARTEEREWRDAINNALSACHEALRMAQDAKLFKEKA